ncbi:DUF559 domain-containing protein [candidate division TA06 bacterium]|uniref:DUF559 domain-containing protein n=1 Tax=candidate division TA06 bacterium TaxID=2250710 RepID=A0A933MLE7_UNCT6|nr:DUF559 domain-containing protein [candidate division TA06 bacterium]
MHNKQKEQDKLRDEVIGYLGIKVVRIANKNVLENIDEVMKRISVVL